MKISDVCEIDFRKKIPGKNKSIIACSFFLMRESYKDITTYLNGLNQLSDTIQEQGSTYNPPIYLRVYHDKSVLESKDPRVIQIMQKLENNPNVELVMYKPTKYVTDPEYAGLFGVILRYFSYFGFEDNDVDYVYVIDIDFTDKQIELNQAKFLYDTLNKTRQENIDFIYENSICYMPFWKSRISNNLHIVLGNMNGGRVKVDPAILKNFLDDFSKEKSQNSLVLEFKKAYLQYLLSSKNSNAMKKKMTSFKQDARFVYGFDEFFVTYFIFPAILEQSGIKIMVHTRNSYGGISLVLHRCFDRFIENIRREKNVKILHFYYHLLKIVYNVGNSANANRVNTHPTREEMVGYISREFPKFIDYFKYHDYEGKDLTKHRVYEKFYKIMQDQSKMNSQILGINSHGKEFLCLMQNDKYYYHNNSNEILDEPKKQMILKDLVGNIKSKNKNNMNFRNNSNKVENKRKTTKQRKIIKRRQTTKQIEKNEKNVRKTRTMRSTQRSRKTQEK